MDEISNDFNAIANDPNFTVEQEHTGLEAESFVRDFVTAEHINRRSLIQTRLQGAQRVKDITSEEGALNKQWYEIGTKSTGPLQEEAVKVETTYV